jgi:hypothetical protein
MNLLVWRLHRIQVVFAAAALVVVAVVLAITGTVMAHDYRVFLSQCGATGSCSETGQLFSGDGAIIDLVNFTIVVPLLFGLFWGAPLLAKEFEDGTHNLAWTQSVTRRHWFRTTVAWALMAAVVWAGALTVLVSWWRSPENVLDTRFPAFDIQGIVPVAYALFAVALGIAVGAFIPRVLPAIATTLGVFVAVRVVIGVYLRPHYLAAVTKHLPVIGAGSSSPPGAWVISQGLAGPHGQYIPAVCRPGPTAADMGAVLPCLAAHGYQQVIAYQPAGRFWMFQGIESAIFIVLAVTMLVLAYRRVLSRDA